MRDSPNMKARAAVSANDCVQSQLPLPFSVLLAVWIMLLGALFRELTGSPNVVTTAAVSIQVFEIAILAEIAAIFLLFQRHLPRPGVAGVLALGWALLLTIHVLRGYFVGFPELTKAIRSVGPIAAMLVLGTFLGAKNYSFAKIRSAIEVVALLAGALALLRMLGGVAIYEDFASGRPATSSGAMLIGAGLIFAVAGLRPMMATGLLWRSGVVGFLMLTLFITQQASAVLATSFGVITVLALQWTPSGRWRIASLAGLLSIFVPLLLLRDWVLGLLPEWIIGSRWQRRVNLEWRQEIWEQVLRDFESWPLLNKLIGLPGGVSPTVQLNNFIYWEHSLHSQYIGVLATTGAIGFFLFMALLIALVFFCVRSAVLNTRRGQMDGPLAAAFCTQLAVFSYSYELRPEHSLLLAIPLVLASRSHSVRRIHTQNRLSSRLA